MINKWTILDVIFQPQVDRHESDNTYFINILIDILRLISQFDLPKS